MSVHRSITDEIARDEAALSIHATVQEALPAATFPREAGGNGLNLAVLLSVVVLALLGIAAIWPGLLSGSDPLRADPLQVLQAPSWSHWLGTDQLGRDVYSRIVHGAGHSLTIGVSATALAALAGVVLGLLAGLAGRWGDEVISRILDVLGAFPELLFALLVVAITGPGTTNVILAIAIGGVARFARVIRAETLVVKRSGYVEQAIVQGRSRFRIVVRHILPNALGPIPVITTIGLGASIIAAASLSYLGLGPQPPSPEWGAMLSEGRNYLRVAWWGGVFPGVTVTLTVVALTVVGRRLQRRFEGRHV